MKQRQIDVYYVVFPKKPVRKLLPVFDLADSLKTSIIVVFLIFVFAFRVVGVSGTSMVPTLEDGDWLAITSITNGYRHGDIVVVTKPWEKNIPIIKRVIALPGDTLDIDFDSGAVYINGEIQDEPYIAEKTHLEYNAKLPMTIPEGYIFVMGDNRNNSLDSRSDKVGLIDEKFVLGKAFFRFYKDTGFLKNGGF